MSTTTPHLSLLKPDGDELVNVLTQVNQNYDKIDAKALSLETRVNNLEAVLGLDAEWAPWVPTFCYLGGTLIPSFDCNEDETRYMKIGAIVFCVVEFSFTSTTTANGFGFGVGELPVPGSGGCNGTGVLDVGSVRVPYIFNEASVLIAGADRMAHVTDAVVIDESMPAGTMAGTFTGAFSYSESTF